MVNRLFRPSKTFTVEEANACLPLVRAITSDIVELSRELIDRRHRLDILMRGRAMSPGDPYGDELTQVREQLEKDARRLDEFARELRDLGVEPKGAHEGLVDFPALIDGRLAYLCWKYTEPEVLYWHELDAGFAGRQPLTVGSLSDEDTGGESHLYED